MKYNALGLIEVKGFLGAIAAADAALKAAGVTCLGVEIIKGGLVTVKLGGEVGAVQAAVDAGAETAVQLNVLLTRHVIPRVHEETATLVVSPVKANELKADTDAGKATAGISNRDMLSKDTPASIAASAKPTTIAVSTKASELKPDTDVGKVTTGMSNREKLSKDLAASIAAKAKSTTTAASTKTSELMPDTNAGNVTAGTSKQVVETSTSKLPELAGNKFEPEVETAAALEQAETQAASRSKKKESESAPVAKRSKNTKKASS